jgi:O-antigen/teichoic acid export membrane protein
VTIEETSYRRVVATLRRTGVVDGIWTLTASAGSKAQMLVVLAVAGATGGVAGVGHVVLATSTAILVTAVVDLGFSTQIMRAFAAGELVSRRTVVRPLLVRAAVLAPVALVVAAVVVAPTVAEPGAWTAAVGVYALGYLASSVVTRLAYGVGRFRGGATLNGVVRAGTIPVLLLVRQTGAPLWTALVVLAVGELVIALAQYRLVPPSARRDEPAGTLGVRRTWRFGVAPLINTVMNRSDVVLVSFFAATAAVGVYGLASQVEGALTTIALIPAGAAVAYAARSRSRADVASQRRVVTGVVAAGYLVLAVPVLVAPEALVELVFSVTLHDADALRICVVAGIFSCLGGVATQQITGLGRQNALVAVWLATLVVGLAGLSLGAATAGAVGAAWGALGRDVVFCLLSWTFLLFPRSRVKEDA